MKLQELLYASAKKVPGFKVSTKKVLDGQALYENKLLLKIDLLQGK